MEFCGGQLKSLIGFSVSCDPSRDAVLSTTSCNAHTVQPSVYVVMMDLKENNEVSCVFQRAPTQNIIYYTTICQATKSDIFLLEKESLPKFSQVSCGVSSWRMHRVHIKIFLTF